MNTLVHDVRSALRSIQRSPGVATAAILTLALGIGANAAIFSVVNGVILRPLPYDEPADLVRVWPEFGWSRAWLADLNERTRTLEAVSAYAGIELTITGEGQPAVLHGGRVSWNHFELLGATPVVGRTFVEADAAPGATPVVLLSHDFWQRRFDADPGLIGRQIDLEGNDATARTVIGILRPEYRSLLSSAYERQFWIPLTMDAADPGTYYGRFLAVVGRIDRPVSLRQVSNDVRQVAATLQERFPRFISEEEAAGAHVVSLHGALVGPVRPMTLLLFGAAGLVLLLACANVANLLLARADAREREMAIRKALGASSGKIVRHVMVESVLLGLAGGALGVLVAMWLLDAFVAQLPVDFPRLASIRIDRYVLGFVMTISLAVSGLFGAFPAVRAVKGSVTASLKRAGRGSPGGRRPLRHGLVALEVAIAMVLVVSAALMARSVWELSRVDPGFDASRVAVLALHPSSSRYPDAPQQRAFYAAVAERLTAAPGVTSVGAVQALPLGDSVWATTYAVAEQPAGDDAALPTADLRIVTPGYFRTIGVAILEGRELTERDREESPPVAVINQRLARLLWSNSSAIGRQIRTGSEVVTVVGVMTDVRQRQLDLAPLPAIYRPHGQRPLTDMFVLAKVTGDPNGHLAALREAVWSVDDRVPITNAGSLEAVVVASIGRPRFLASVLLTFGVAALLLGMVGVYGVMSHTVGQQLPEIAVRMALGATRGVVIQSVLTHTLLTIGIGLAVGAAGALAATRVLSGALYEVSATDPATFVGVALLLSLTAVVAAVVPVQRAARADPATILRAE